LNSECPECGEEVSKNDDFCGNCGAELEEGFEEETDVDIVIGAKEVLTATGVLFLAFFLVNGFSSNDNSMKENTLDSEGIMSKVLKAEDIPEGFYGKGNVTDDAEIVEKLYTSLYLAKGSKSDGIDSYRSYTGKKARISESIFKVGNLSRAQIYAESLSESDSFTRIDSSETDGKAWVNGTVDLTGGRMDGADTLVNMTLVMHKGDYVGEVNIRKRDLYTIDTRKIMEASLNNMGVKYESEELSDALTNRYPPRLSNLA
jgi:hypothetical protein